MGCASSAAVQEGNVDDHASTCAVRRGFASETEATRNADAQAMFLDRVSALDSGSVLQRLEKSRSRRSSLRCGTLLPPAHQVPFPEVVIDDGSNDEPTGGSEGSHLNGRHMAPTPLVFDLLESEVSDEGRTPVGTAAKDSPIIVPNVPGQADDEDEDAAIPSTDNPAWVPVRRRPSLDSIVARGLRSNAARSSEALLDCDKDPGNTPPSFYLVASSHNLSVSPSASAEPTLNAGPGGTQSKLHRLPLFTLPPRNAKGGATRKRSPSFMKLADV
jgi:hypothetical protein